MPHQRQQNGRRWRFTRYLGELAQLRLAVEQNVDDFEASDQILYLADANVVRLFLSPYDNWSSVSPFRRILDQRKEELGIATAVITAEYIFSRRLTKQKGYPIFVATEHSDEIVGYFHRLDAQYKAGRRANADDKEQGSPDLKGRLAEADSVDEDIGKSLSLMQEKISSGTYDAAELRRLFDENIPRTVTLLDQKRLLRQPFFPRQQFTRLLRDDLVRPLHLAPHIDRRRLENLPVQEIKQWSSILEAFAHYDTAQDDEPRDRILSRDATVLTQLISINQDLIERKVPVKVVLITEDQKIHYAAAYREIYKRFNGENFLRRPIQFSPALNLQEMPNLVRDSNSTVEIKSAIDSILGLRRSITRDSLHDVIYQLAVALRSEYQSDRDPGLAAWKVALQKSLQETVQKSFQVTIVPDIEVGLNEVNAAWERLSNNAIGLNVELLAKRFHEELDPLANQIKALGAGGDAKDLGKAFEDYQAAQLDVLERQHIQWCLEWLLADRVRSGPQYIPRGPVLIRQDELGVAGDGGLRQVIEDVMDCKPDEAGNLAMPLARIIRRHDFPDRLIIAAVVAYRCGAWTQAREFGQRGREQLYAMLPATPREGDDSVEGPVRNNIRELSYFVALCQRFELSEIIVEQHPTERAHAALRQKFEDADRAHRAAIERAAPWSDFFAQIRARAERSALHLTAVAIESIHPDLELLKNNQDGRRGLSIGATERLRRVSSDLESRFSKEIRHPETLHAELHFKANMNLVSALALCGLEGLYGASGPAALAGDALARARPILQAQPDRFPPHLAVECDICEWLYLDDRSVRARRVPEIVTRCNMVLGNQDARLTRLDREALRLYGKRLAEWQTETARLKVRA